MGTMFSTIEKAILGMEYSAVESLLTSRLTAYLTPYTTLVHQDKGTKYPR